MEVDRVDVDVGPEDDVDVELHVVLLKVLGAVWPWLQIDADSQSVLYNSQCLSQPNLSSLRNCNDILEGVEAFGGSHGIQAVHLREHV